MCMAKFIFEELSNSKNSFTYLAEKVKKGTVKQRLKFVFIYFFINNMLHSFSKSYSKYIYKDKIKRKNYQRLNVFFSFKIRIFIIT